MGTAPKAPRDGSTPPEIKVGDMVLERYRVAEQIASGGHSVVFRGTDERLSRPVCIKVFSGLGGQSGVGRTSYEHFVQEAFALSRLTHPNTLRIYDFGHLGPKDSGGMPLQVCEYMNGGTLSQVIREHGKQSVVETLPVIAAMCAALSEAHGLGIVHRDIKPQNILFGTVGTKKLPKLADFGIAKWSADADEHKEKRADDTAIVAGQKLAMYSPSWAAPEQLAGQPVSAATDIYSLACVAVYMLSTKAIFADEDVYAGYKKRRHADELVREALRPLGISRPVIELLTRALMFDPKRRLAKVEELASELATLLEPVTEEQHRLPAEETKSLKPAAEPVGAASPAPVANPPAVPVAAAPTPPVVPQVASTPANSYSQPQLVREPWMVNIPHAAGPVHRLALSDVPLAFGDRRLHFVKVVNNVVDIASRDNTRVRVTLMSGPLGNRIVHIKGLTCFISHLGGRPSPAVVVEHPGDIALVTPRAQEIGHIRLATGSPDGAQTVYPLGSELVAVAIEDCADAILFDFGPGSDAYFVYTSGRTIPKIRR